MGFDDAKTWRKWFFLCIIISIAHVLYGYTTSTLAFSEITSEGAEAILVIGYLCVITAAILAFGILFTDELKDNKIAIICFVVFAFVGGFLVIVGFAIIFGDLNKDKKANPRYADEFPSGALGGLIGFMAGIFAVLAGIFGILDLVGVGGK